jgi:predicted membrane channel-forming protein YqfA (hemolysin III family)
MKHRALAALVVCLIAAALFAPVIGQDPAYHVMADHRTMLGVPNALNVFSNIAFLLVGAIGIIIVERGGARGSRRAPYLLFFTGTLLTAFGSTWYHLSPDNARVVWDRLPMTIAFTGLLTAVLAERVSERIARNVFAPLVASGASSVIYWYVTELAGHGDLRPYALIQFGSLAVILVVLLVFREREPGTGFLWAGLACYVAAKIFELADAPVYSVLPVSGHTLKHLFAAAGVGAIALMLDARCERPRARRAWLPSQTRQPGLPSARPSLRAFSPGRRRRTGRDSSPSSTRR